MANKIQIKHGSGVPGGGKLSSFELGYATQTGQLYISTNGSNILGITPSSHSHVWSEVTNKPAVLDSGIRGARIQFTVDGNANTYYPVVVVPPLLSPDMIKLSVSRVYSEPAPDTWNTPTHKGGLTLTVFLTGYGTWSGNSSAYYVVEHAETYTTICSGIDTHVSSGLIFYLRGGGARYSVTGDCWLGASATVHLGGYTAPDGAVFPAMAYNQAKVDSSIKAKKFAPSSHTHAYVPTTRTVNSKALSANISLTAADVGAVPTSRTVNGKALSANISLTAANVGAAASTHTHTIANITNLPTISSTATGSSLVQRHSSGYIFATYFNSSNGIENTQTVHSYAFFTSDGYLRKMDLTRLRAVTGLYPNLYGTSVPTSLLPGQIYVRY